MHSLNALIRRWASQDVGSLPAERAGAVAETFAVLGSIATADVIHMYSISGGMENMDNEYWRYWPLSEIRAENKESSPFGILFADYLISSWCYRLKPVSNEQVRFTLIALTVLLRPLWRAVSRSSLMLSLRTLVASILCQSRRPVTADSSLN
jgi:hypothetical protein